MFSDSHTHILNTKEQLTKAISKAYDELITDPFEMMASLQREDFKFVMDIGTEPGDLKRRMVCVEELAKGNIPSFIHFAAGLWPHKESIEAQDTSIRQLESDINYGMQEARKKTKISKEKGAFFALGECGLDRYWNGEGALKLKEGGTLDIEGEEALFIEQLKLAKKYDLAVIIHSRDAYKDTLKCIDKVGHHKGVIHCYSYGIEEAKMFLERGWYISFVGNITFPKTRSKMEQMQALVSSIPLDHLLLETDAPYMTPNPLRGITNTPLYIKHTYAKASEYLKINVKDLCDIVYHNCCTLFSLNA